MFATILVVSVALIAYTYFVYPAILWLLSRGARDDLAVSDEHLPGVTLIVAAYNEAKVMQAKLENCLAIDYPADRFEVIVASDGSDDGTNEIVARFADRGVRLNPLPRGGKTRALNQTVPLATHEVVVFSDSNAMYRPDAVRQLARHLADPRVGAVSGDVRLVNKNEDFSESEGLYYRYERWLQLTESRLASMVGVDGAMYAIRKALYVPPSDDIICDDFVISMTVVRNGHRVIYNPLAVAEEDSAPTLRQELRRRSRYIAATTHALLKGEGLPRLTQPRAWWMYVSHKLLRWLVPVFMIAALVCNLALVGHWFWNALLAGQLGFYGLALLGAMSVGGGSSAIVRVPFYFCLQNTGALMGLVRGVLKMQKAAWTSPTRTLVTGTGAGDDGAKGADSTGDSR